MPAVTPAAVHTVSELRTKMGSGSTVTAGNSRASASANAQCVVARQPSSRPARAARNAPVQTLTTRRQWAEALRTHSTASAWAVSAPAPPGSTRVSTDSVGWGRGLGSSASPLLVAIGAPSTLATVTR